MSRKSIWELTQAIHYKEDELFSMNKDEVLSAFGLDWNVELNQVYTKDDDGLIEIENRFASVRVCNDGARIPLEVVGTKYKVTQNSEFIELLDSLRKRDIAEFCSGGYIKNGQGVYAIMKLNEDVKIENDPHAPYLIARTSHDGSSSVTVAPLLIRIGCTNAITRTLMNANSKYSKKHTTFSQLNVDDLINRVTIVRNDISNYVSLANNLINLSYSDGDFESLLIKQFDIPAHILTADEEMLSRGDKILRNRAMHYRAHARRAWYSENQDTQSNIANTKYGAFQAIIESIDHHGHGMNERQAISIINDKDSTLKDKALRLITTGA